MKTDDAIIENLEVNYPLENFAPLEQILFLDIETTGFTARTSYLYMTATRNSKSRSQRYAALNHSV